MDKAQPVVLLRHSYVPVKRAIDIVGSLVLLALLSPLFFIITMAIALESPGSIFFRQQRIGFCGRRFGMFKFRTLQRRPTANDLAGTHIALAGQDKDITRVGAFLRRSGLNELPQLLNILHGEMSFIGPRPALLDNERYYSDWHRARLAVRPGVTGLAQVCGRNAIPWGWRIELDRYYISHISPWLDLAILCKTTWVVATRHGAEGDEALYYNFNPPGPHDHVLDKLAQQGLWRCTLTAPPAAPQRTAERVSQLRS